MIRIFPEIYPDEILYSLFSRYYIMSKNRSVNTSFVELFGTRNGSANSFYYPHLDYLCKQLPESLGYTPENLVLNHTVMPYFFPFMTKDRYLKVIDSIKNDCLIMKLAGIEAGGLFPTDVIKICPKCVEEDILKYKEAYFHRQHQMPGNYICQIHKQILFEHTLSQTKNMEYINIADTKFHPSNVIYNKEIEDYSAQLNLLMEGVLNKYLIEDISNTYKIELLKQGYCHSKRLFNQRKIRVKFKEFYSEEFLNFFKSNISIDNTTTWINWLFSTKSKDYVHPVRHLLFIQFLFGTVNNLISKIDENKGISFQSKNIYTTTPLSEKDIFWIEWDKNLVRNIENGTTNISELCRIMKSCRKTIIFHAKKLGVIDKLKTKSKLKEHNCNPKKNNIDSYKQKILEYLKVNPEANRTIVRKLLYKEFMFISKEEPEWFNKILPMNKFPKLKNPQINWETRDLEYEKLVKEEIQRSLISEKPVQILKSRICTKVGIYHNVNKYSEKLPLTIKAISEGVESYDKFIRRKIVWHINQLILSNIDLNDTNIVKRYFRKKGLFKFNKIVFEIIEEMEKSKKI